MTRKLGIIALAACLAALCAPPAQAASLMLGQTVEYQYLYACITCNYSNASNGNYVVGPGIEVANVADDLATMDISDTNLYIDYDPWTGSWNPAAFNGFRITDILGLIPSFTSVTINPATNMVGLDASRITFDADHIWVNWQNLNFDPNTVVSLDVNGGSVPEPGSTLLLLGMGLAGLRAWRKRA